MSEITECLLCEGTGESPTFPFGTCWEGKLFRYLRCQDCSSSFVDPLPSADELVRMYERDSYHSDFYAETNEEIARTSLPAFARHFPREARLLDFGCGNGSFLLGASRAGFDAVGVELDEATRKQAAANSGCRVLSLDAVADERMLFDVIHLGDVLEHLPRPTETMRMLEKFLAESGKFFIEGPLEDNPSFVYYAARGFGWSKQRLRRHLYGSSPPYHLFRTSARAQRRFFEQRLGYAVRDFQVYESGWPYFNPGDDIRRPGSPGRAIKMMVGAAALKVSGKKLLGGEPFGNRFGTVLEISA